MRAGATRVHDAFGDALAIEVRDLLDERIVLERRGAAFAHGAEALVVGDWMTLTSGQRAMLFGHGKLLR